MSIQTYELVKSEPIELVSIMDINFINLSKTIFLEGHLHPILANREKCFIVTANPEIVMKTREDHEYKAIVQTANYVIPDGAGVIFASKILKQPIEERIAGFDLMLDMLDYANKNGLSCFFLGSKEEVNRKTVRKIEEKYPNITIAGSHHGYFSTDDPTVVQHVKDTNPDIVFVALGAPRQEKWIAKNMSKFSKGLFMGVGGSFDVIAGEVKRAPDMWINLNLEWLYRLLKQPFRWKRIAKAFVFIFLVFLKGRKKE